METESMSSCLYWYRTHSWTVTFQLNGGKVQWEARVCTMFQGKATFRYSSLWKKLFVFLLCRVTKPQLMNMVNQVRMIILLQNHLLRRQQLCHLTGPQIHNPFIPVCWGYSAESWLSLQEPHKWLKHSILTSQLSHSHSLRHPVQGLCMTRNLPVCLKVAILRMTNTGHHLACLMTILLIVTLRQVRLHHHIQSAISQLKWSASLVLSTRLTPVLLTLCFKRLERIWL